MLQSPKLLPAFTPGLAIIFKTRLPVETLPHSCLLAKRVEIASSFRPQNSPEAKETNHVGLGDEQTKTFFRVLG